MTYLLLVPSCPVNSPTAEKGNTRVLVTCRHGRLKAQLTSDKKEQGFLVTNLVATYMTVLEVTAFIEVIA